MAKAVYRRQQGGFRAYGGSAQLWRYKGPEVVLHGPYQTGKTMCCLHKVLAIMVKYPGTRALMVRLTYKSLLASVVPTWENKVLAVPPQKKGTPVTKWGGERPEFYELPNGSRLYLGGMDNAQKILSSEWDVVYVPQCEELSLKSWEDLVGRASGRAGNTPYPQVIGDANPGPGDHWILRRSRIKKFQSTHEDNPTIYERDELGRLTGQLTENGEKAMDTLRSLTGLRYKRGYLGLWVGAEGAVYEFDVETHTVPPDFEIKPEWRRYRAIDFGYTNPFVCQWWAQDDDGRLYMYRELYVPGHTVQELLPAINELSHGERYVCTVADWDAEDRATLAQGIRDLQGNVLSPGIETLQADKRVTVGLEAVRERLRVQGDGKPRLFIVQDCTITSHPLLPRMEEERWTLEEGHKPMSTREEFSSYSYPDERRNRNEDEHPIKEDDHGMDTMRYIVMQIDGPPAIKGYVRVVPRR